MPGPHALLSPYAARVISCGTGVLSSLSPFLGCLSGSSELGWGSVELLPDIRRAFFLFLNALFVLASASTRRFGYSMLCLSVALFPGAGVGCLLLSSRALWRRLGGGALPCSSVCGLHCTGPTNARESQWETVISCAGGQVFLVRLGGASSAMRAVHVASGCSMEGSPFSVSFWLRMPLSRGCWVLVTERSVLCPLSSVHLCCLFFVKNLLSSLWTGVDVALALILARLLLQGCCPLVPRSLPPVLCGGGTGLLAWTYHCLRLGDWSLGLASLFVRLPSAASPRDGPVGVCVCLHILKCCLYYFLEILDFISSESLVPSSVTFDSFSSSAPSIFMPGLIRKRGWECWSVSSSTTLRGS